MDELIARIASLIRRYTRFNQQAGAVQKLDFDGLQIDLENRSVTTEKMCIRDRSYLNALYAGRLHLDFNAVRQFQFCLLYTSRASLRASGH